MQAPSHSSQDQSAKSLIPVVDPVGVVGFLDVLVHGVVRQVPEGGPLSGRLPFQSVYPAVERAVGQVVVDGGLRGSPMIDGRIIGKTANSSQGSHHHSGAAAGFMQETGGSQGSSRVQQGTAPGSVSPLEQHLHC